MERYGGLQAHLWRDGGLMKTIFDVVGMESVKLGFTLGDLKGLNCLAEDSGEICG